MNKKKILIIPGWNLWPVATGGAIAQLCFVEDLCTHFDVHILCTKENIATDNLSRFKQVFPKITVHYSDFSESKTYVQKTTKKLKSIYSKVTRKAPEFKNALLKETYLDKLYISIRSIFQPDKNKIASLEKLINEIQFDIIQVEMINNIGLIDFIPENIESVFVHHELFELKVNQELSYIKGIKDKYKQSLIHLIQYLECNYLNKYKKVVVFTEEDKNDIQSKVSSKLFVSPFSLINSDSSNHNNTDFSKLLFLGSSEHLPNKHGVEWFLNNVMAEIKGPSKLYITGNWPLSIKNHYKNQNIIFTGYLSKKELDEIFRTSIVIVPIFIGSGIKVKLMEALFYGKPIISTSIGVRGLKGIVNKHNILIANTVSEFINALNDLITNPEKAKIIANNAKVLYDQNFEYKVNFLKRLSVYSKNDD